MPIMQVKYIFLRKNNGTHEENNKEVSILSLKQIFDIIFSNVTKDSFEIEIDNTIHKINYKSSKLHNGNTYYLKLIVEGTRFYCARILNEVNMALIKGTHRKDYNIILSFDGISLYYCDEIYPKFNLFERKIRELIFGILIKAFGVNWYNATISSDLKIEMEKQTKGMKQSDLIEKALYEMTIFQLETYLFTPYREVNVIDVIDNELNPGIIAKKLKMR